MPGHDPLAARRTPAPLRRRAGGVHDRAPPADGLRIGPQRNALAARPGHRRRRRPGPAAHASCNGLARRAPRPFGFRRPGAAADQGSRRGGAVRPPPGPVHQPRPGVLRHHLASLHRPRRRNAGPVRQEQGRPQRLQADGSRHGDRRRRHSGGKPHVAGQHRRRHHPRPGGRAPSGPVRRQAGVPGRRRRDDLEAAGRGGRGPGVGIHSRCAAARHQGGARHRSRRSRPVRDRRGRSPTPRPDGAAGQGGQGRRGREGVAPLCRLPQSGTGRQGCGHASGAARLA